MSSYPDHASYLRSGSGQAPAKDARPRDEGGKFTTKPASGSADGATKTASSVLSAPIKPRIKRSDAGSF